MKMHKEAGWDFPSVSLSLNISAEKYGLTPTIQADHASSSPTPSGNHSPLTPKRRITHEKIIIIPTLLILLLPVQIINADVQSQNSVLHQHSIEIERCINNGIRKPILW